MASGGTGRVWTGRDETPAPEAPRRRQPQSHRCTQALLLHAALGERLRAAGRPRPSPSAPPPPRGRAGPGCTALPARRRGGPRTAPPNEGPRRSGMAGEEAAEDRGIAVRRVLRCGDERTRRGDARQRCYRRRNRVGMGLETDLRAARRPRPGKVLAAHGTANIVQCSVATKHEERPPAASPQLQTHSTGMVVKGRFEESRPIC